MTRRGLEGGGRELFREGVQIQQRVSHKLRLARTFITDEAKHHSEHEQHSSEVTATE